MDLMIFTSYVSLPKGITCYSLIVDGKSGLILDISAKAPKPGSAGPAGRFLRVKENGEFDFHEIPICAGEIQCVNLC